MMKSIVFKSVLSAALVLGLPALAEDINIKIEGADAKLVYEGLQIKEDRFTQINTKIGQNIICEEDKRVYACNLNIDSTDYTFYEASPVGEKDAKYGKAPKEDVIGNTVRFKNDKATEVQFWIKNDTSTKLFDGLKTDKSISAVEAYIDDKQVITEGAKKEGTYANSIELIKGEFMKCFKLKKTLAKNVQATCIFTLSLENGEVKKTE